MQFFISLASLFILGLGISTPSSWAFSKHFPDNTTYTIHEFESGSHGGVTGAWGVNDPIGNNAFLTTFNPDSGNSSGAYSVAADGTLSIIFNQGTPDEETITGILSEDGQTIILGYSEFNDSEKKGSIGIGVGVKTIVLNNGALPSTLLLLLGD